MISDEDCYCSCHNMSGVMHFMACCCKCSCGRNIKFSAFDKHIENCFSYKNKDSESVAMGLTQLRFESKSDYRVTGKAD